MVSPEVAVELLPHFSDGYVSVQDGASQIAAQLLDLSPTDRVLDACAAPGGKTAHMLEQGVVNVIAIEQDPARIGRLEKTLSRLDLRATIICHDAADTEQWWDGQLFDRILLDAPCSATGIIRRHPDIKNHRQPEDIEQLTQQQAWLLKKLWPLLKPNGILVYSTCSILPAENTMQIAQFLQTHPDAKEWPIIEDWGIAQLHGRQILPGHHNMDGFYYARLRKESSEG
jgi:16S rRNA (cytosine967-C5)-methyltransferase